MRVNRRLLVGSVAAAVVISLAGGWATSRRDASRSAADDEVSYSRPVVEQYPSIGTNAEVSGKALPDVVLEDNDGNDVALRSLTGTPMIINYWYSTCAPCRQELMAFAAVHAELGDRIRFIGVNPTDGPDVNLSFAAKRGVRYELLRDPDGAYATEIGIATAPMTVFVAPDGTIVHQTGVLDEEQLREVAAELVS